MTFREFVQQRRNQQLAEGSSGRRTTQHRLIQAYGPMFRDLGISRKAINTFAIDRATGLMRSPREIIRSATGGSLNDREIAYHSKKYTRQAFDRDPEHFKKLLALQTGRHVPRTGEFVKDLETDTRDRLNFIDAAREIASNRGDQQGVDHLDSMASEIEKTIHSGKPLHHLRQLVPPGRAALDDTSSMGDIPQSARLQRLLQKNMQRRIDRGASVPTSSDSLSPRRG